MKYCQYLASFSLLHTEHDDLLRFAISFHKLPFSSYSHHFKFETSLTIIGFKAAYAWGANRLTICESLIVSVENVLMMSI